MNIMEIASGADVNGAVVHCLLFSHDVQVPRIEAALLLAARRRPLAVHG
jgi:hypothetical protein